MPGVRGTRKNDLLIDSIKPYFTDYQSTGVCVVFTCNANGWRGIGGTGSQKPLVHETAFQTDTGGNARGADAVDLQRNRSAATQVASSPRSVIIGGQNNEVGVFSEDSAIVSGDTNKIDRGGTGVICGGANGTITSADYSGILAGQTNTVNGRWGVVCGGRSNLVGHEFSAIFGGDDNEISDRYAAIIVGITNEIGSLGQRSVILGGTDNYTNNEACIVFGNGGLANTDTSLVHGNSEVDDGDAQGGHYILREEITHDDANWHGLFIEGTTAISVPADSVFAFNILIAGTTSGCTKSFGFRIEGTVENDGGTTSILAQTVTTLYDTDDVSFDAQVAADNANDELDVQVQDTDAASDVVKWVAHVVTAEVTHAA